MNYAAIGVGNYDLAADYFNADLPSQQYLPFVSANTIDATGKARFLPYTSVQAGSYKIGITSLTGPAEGKTILRSTHWKAALKKQLPEMKKQFDFIILLSSLSTKENKEIASRFPQINVIINADKEIENLSPSLIGKTLITQTNTLGQYLGVLDIQISPTLLWKKNYFALNDLKRREYAISKEMEDTRNEKSSSDKVAKLNLLTKEQEELPLKLEELQKELVTQQGSSFSFDFLPITSSLFKDPVIEAILQ